MKVLADESVDAAVVRELRYLAYEVKYIAEMDPGLSDDLVLRRANDAGAILLTADKDFGELVFRERLMTKGVVLIRLQGLSAQRKATIVARVVTDHRDRLEGSFVVITPGQMRIRRTNWG